MLCYHIVCLLTFSRLFINYFQKKPSRKLVMLEKIILFSKTLFFQSVLLDNFVGENPSSSSLISGEILPSTSIGSVGLRGLMSPRASKFISLYTYSVCETENDIICLKKACKRTKWPVQTQKPSCIWI